MSTHYVASAKENQLLLEPVLTDLNEQGSLDFVGHYYSDEEVIQYTSGRDFGLVFPKSELSLNRIANQLISNRGDQGDEVFRSKIQVGYSPVVFLVNPAIASSLKVHDEPLTWRKLARFSGTGSALSIRHASPRKVDGEVVALAQHLALGYEPQSLGERESDERRVQQQVEEYGPDDQEVLRRALGHGWKADIVIAQERSVIAFARDNEMLEGVVVYPHDGTLALPTSLALTSMWDRPDSSEAFEQLAMALGEVGQSRLASAGLHKDIEDLTSTEGVHRFAMSTRAPQGLQWAPHSGGRTLIVPSRPAARGIRDLSLKGQRSVDVCLVFDSSGSMAEGGKFQSALSGIDSFLGLLASPNSRVCLIRIQTTATTIVPLWPRKDFQYQRAWLEPDGQTALIDAVAQAVDVLVREGDPNNIRAILGFTDGQENASIRSLEEVEKAFRTNSKIRFYGIAYGSDADSATLDRFAGASDGLVVGGGPSEIKSLYEKLSTYV
jgi:Mg-chelatase subunit ChlD